jgi:hypothetical protein
MLSAFKQDFTYGVDVFVSDHVAAPKSPLGTAVFGSYRIFAALSDFFHTFFHPVAPVRPEHIVTSTGSGSVIDQLAEARLFMELFVCCIFLT